MFFTYVVSGSSRRLRGRLRRLLPVLRHLLLSFRFLRVYVERRKTKTARAESTAVHCQAVYTFCSSAAVKVRLSVGGRRPTTNLHNVPTTIWYTPDFAPCKIRRVTNRIRKRKHQLYVEWAHGWRRQQQRQTPPCSPCNLPRRRSWHEPAVLPLLHSPQGISAAPHAGRHWT